MPTYKFTTNVPATVDLKYIDIVPSEKGGPQIRFKGTIDGTEKMFAYLPGKLGDQIAALTNAGVIAPANYPTEVTEAVEIKPLRRQFQMMKEQLAGDKYGTFKIVGNGGASAAVPANGTPAVAAGATLTDEQIRHGKAACADTMKQATSYVIDRLVPLFDAKSIQVSDDVVYKFAFSIWQKWNDRGLLQ